MKNNNSNFRKNDDGENFSDKERMNNRNNYDDFNYNRDYNNYGNNFPENNNHRMNNNFNDNSYYQNLEREFRQYDSRNNDQYRQRQGNHRSHEFMNNDFGYGTSDNSNWRDNNDWNNSNRNNYNNRNNQQDRGWWDKTKDEVSSWFGDDDAERRRRMDEMKEGNHRGKGPKNYKRSDERIKENVNDKLSDHYMLDASDIEVEVSDGEVTLNGTVNSKNAKRSAEDVADSVLGVSHVQNNLRVNIHSTDSNTGTTTTNTVYNNGNRNKKDIVSHN